MPKGRTTKTKNSGGTRHGGRVVLSVDVEPHVREALRALASGAGVSMAQYVSNALAEQRPAYATNAAAVAQPILVISHRIAMALTAIERGDAAAANAELVAAKAVVVDALRPLRLLHESDVRMSDTRPYGGWTGKRSNDR